MSFPISAALLDAIVLSVVAQEPEGTYGYRITQQVTHTLELSESTLYPVLRRLCFIIGTHTAIEQQRPLG